MVNALSGVEEWVTIAFVPFVQKDQEANARVKGKARRCGVLQRTLYLALREAIASSHAGTDLEDAIGGYSRLYFRVLFYCCDQMEERAVLCLKSGMCAYPCSNCMVAQEDLGVTAALSAGDRRVIRTLQRQNGLMQSGKSRMLPQRRRRAALKAMDSYNAFIPALSCMAGLATPSIHLHNMIAFHALHVRWFALLFRRVPSSESVFLSNC